MALFSRRQFGQAVQEAGHNLLSYPDIALKFQSIEDNAEKLKTMKQLKNNMSDVAYFTDGSLGALDADAQDALSADLNQKISTYSQLKNSGKTHKEALSESGLNFDKKEYIEQFKIKKTGEIYQQAEEKAAIARLRAGDESGLVGLQTQIGKDAALGAQLQMKISEREDKQLQQKITNENDLRDYLFKVQKEFTGVSDAYSRISASAKNASAAGDLAMIFNYMKMLDPGSTVREGEFATAQSSAGVDQRISGLYNRLMTGERLTEEQRLDFFDRSTRLYKNALIDNNKRVSQVKNIADRRGLDFENINMNVVSESISEERDIKKNIKDASIAIRPDQTPRKTFLIEKISEAENAIKSSQLNQQDLNAVNDKLNLLRRELKFLQGK